MKLSQQPEYLVAVPAAVSGDFLLARQHLETLLSRVEAGDDFSSLGYVLQILGDVEANLGNSERATQLHERAIALDAQSPLPYLFYAQGLLRAFRDPEKSLAALREAEKVLLSDWRESDDELPKSYYEHEIHALRDEIGRHPR